MLTAYGQIITKWRLNQLDFQLPDTWLRKIFYLLQLVFDPFIFSGFFAAFIASMTWMAALSRFELSFAYPFMSLAFVVVAGMSYFFLQESWTISKTIGLSLVVLGLAIASR